MNLNFVFYMVNISLGLLIKLIKNKYNEDLSFLKFFPIKKIVSIFNKNPLSSSFFPVFSKEINSSQIDNKLIA